MPVSTFYSSADDGTLRSQNATYLTARGGTTVTVVNAGVGANGLAFGQQLSGGNYNLFESFLSFDTSALPDAAVITSAVLSLYVDTDASTTDFITDARIFNWGATLSTADWVNGADLASYTKVATRNSSGVTTAAYNAFTDVAMIPNVSLTGVTYIMLSSARMDSATAPPDSEYLGASAQETAGTSADPKLVVTYHLPLPVGIASETDEALPITASYLKVGLASETDSALAITANKAYAAMGIASETDTALAITVNRAYAAGLASETDTALPITFTLTPQTPAIPLSYRIDARLPRYESDAALPDHRANARTL